VTAMVVGSKQGDPLSKDAFRKRSKMTSNGTVRRLGTCLLCILSIQL